MKMLGAKAILGSPKSTSTPVCPPTPTSNQAAFQRLGHIDPRSEFCLRLMPPAAVRVVGAPVYKVG